MQRKRKEHTKKNSLRKENSVNDIVQEEKGKIACARIDISTEQEEEKKRAGRHKTCLEARFF